MDKALLVVPIPNGSKKAVQLTQTSHLTVNSRMFESIEMLIKQKFIIYWGRFLNLCSLYWNNFPSARGATTQPYQAIIAIKNVTKT